MRTPKETTSKRTQRDYSFAFKLAVVSQVEKGELTYKQAQEHSVARFGKLLPFAAPESHVELLLING
ncbi:hypothetical protein A1OQ_14275 [Enterovibrio norvegicus FF-162]|uniref:hypothetical protein n=1 Tax=Enterovibrio TaxID=188143 RepID=UPI0002F228BE|nr:hypothetical protein [Enterovibrio norvegicus]OEE87837.1 hypothetical protein A1OQ_14275 [Enterovibrio norvegicus FF-162]